MEELGRFLSRGLLGAQAVLLGFLLTAAACGRLIPVFAQNAKADYRSHGSVLLNDLTATPGAVRTLDKDEVCNGGSTKQFRNTTEKMKNDVYALYGVDKHKALATGPRPSKPDAAKPLYEIDHLISLELGGEDDEKNLWPQPYYMHPGAHEKDAVENYLHRQVCSGKMDLQEAQRAIATDWYQVYLDAHLGDKSAASAKQEWACHQGDAWAEPTPLGVALYRAGVTRLFGVKCAKEPTSGAQ